jgi:hypothetical protein
MAAVDANSFCDHNVDATDSNRLYSKEFLLKVMRMQSQSKEIQEKPRCISTDSTEVCSNASSASEVNSNVSDIDVVAQTPSDGTCSTGDVEERTSCPDPEAPAAVETTVMLRNMPNFFTLDDFCRRLRELGFEGDYDFVFVPGDRLGERNMGYAFINLCSSDALTRFSAAFHEVPVRQCLPGSKSKKVCQVRAAQVQGRQANFEKFYEESQSAVEGRTKWRPLFLQSDDTKPRSVKFHDPSRVSPFCVLPQKPRKDASLSFQHATSAPPGLEDLARTSVAPDEFALQYHNLLQWQDKSDFSHKNLFHGECELSGVQQ